MLWLVALALSAAACDHIHAVCDPELRRLAAETQRIATIRAVADCEELAGTDCHGDGACVTAANERCLETLRQLHADLALPHDPAFNEATCRHLLASCP